MSDEKIKIGIAEPQFLIAEGIKSVFNGTEIYAVSGIARSFYELTRLFQLDTPDLIIVDFLMFDKNEYVEFLKIAGSNPELAILVLTNPITRSEITDWTKAGFKNIIYKSADKEEVLTAADSALRGKKFFSDEILDLMFEEKNSPPVKSFQTQLTASETEIVKLISNGLTTKEIAAKKNVSFHTINTHRKNIFRKLEVTNSSELIILAIKAGWIDNIEYYI